MPWYKFTGSNPTLASNYTLVEEEPQDCAGTPQYVCAIQAMDDGFNNPVISEALKDEIIIALNDAIPSANVLLKARPTSN